MREIRIALNIIPKYIESPEYKRAIENEQRKKFYKKDFNMDISNKFGWASEEELGIGTNTKAEIQINKGDFRNTGIEVEYTKLVGDNWRYNLGVTYSNPEINDSGEWVQDNARLQFVAGIGYQKNKFNAGLNYL